jgi:hypothetical protein
MLVRLARLFVPAAIAALAWVGICRALGLSTALTVAGAILGWGGGVLAMALCMIGLGQPEPIEHVEQERPRTVKAEPQKRFLRGERTRSGDRVKAGDPPDRAA